MIKSPIEYLNILQLEQYDPKRLLNWSISNYFKKTSKVRIHLVWTLKAKLIFLTFIFLNLLVLFINVILFGFLLINSFIYFWFIAFFLRIPQEVVIYYIKHKTRQKVNALKKKGLKVIGITGSYGKTTTKVYLQKLLSVKYRVLKTPDSFNTVLGIAKVIGKELTSDFDFFICEMGAYHVGDIKELCEMVLPDYGILTGITSQHLERFGSFENIVKAKFELIDFVDPEKAFLNGEDENVLKKYKTGILYKKLSDIDFPVFSEGLKINLSGAITFCKSLGFTAEEIKEGLSHISQIPHKLEVKKLSENTILIDDAYSSNEQGFYNALDLLETFDGFKKVLVTPGIVELGNSSEEIHKRLSKRIAEVCDFVLFVGLNDRTKSLSSSLRNFKYIMSVFDYKEEVKKLNFEKVVILLENDLPQNY